LPEWFIERGIGEIRAALIEDGQIVEARIQVEGVTAAGSVIGARVTGIGTNGRNAIATGDDGNEYLLPRGAPGVTEGAKLIIEVMREAIPGDEPWKRQLARISEQPKQEASDLEGGVLPFPAPADRMAGWDDLIDEARTGIVRFASGELRLSPTPAMTLIDVDGYLAPVNLAIRGAAEAAKAIRRLDIGGSIGIDLPTAGSKEARHAAAAEIDAVLPQPFERTAVNGFGFVQIVRPRRRASLLELAQDRAPFEARALLRRAAFERPGPKRLVAHSAVIAALESKPQWIETLARQVGGTVELRSDASIPISGGYAESL